MPADSTPEDLERRKKLRENMQKIRQMVEGGGSSGSSPASPGVAPTPPPQQTSPVHPNALAGSSTPRLPPSSPGGGVEEHHEVPSPVPAPEPAVPVQAVAPPVRSAAPASSLPVPPPVPLPRQALVPPGVPASQPQVPRSPVGQVHSALRPPAHPDVKAPVVRKLAIPKIERGPLFITRDKFYDGLKLLQDVQQLSADLEGQIADVGRTWEEDAVTHRELFEAIDRAAGFIEETEHLISPKK